jgi:hypothetical protein
MVAYYDQKKLDMTEDGCCLARWLLGVSHCVGSDLCYWLVTQSGIVIARTTVQHVVRDEYLDTRIGEQINSFDCALENRLNDTNFYAGEDAVFYLDDEDDYEENNGVQERGETPTDEDYGDMLTDDLPEADDVTEEAMDKYLGAKLIFDVGSGSNHEQSGRVVKRSRD